MVYDDLPERIKSVIEGAATYGGVGGVFGIIRFIILGRYSSWREAGASWFVSVAVAVTVGLSLQWAGFSAGLAFGVAAICSLISENIIVAFLVFGTKLEKDPISVIKKIRE